MLEAVPRGFLSNDYTLRSLDGSLAELDVSGWRERAEFELDGVPHRLYREGVLSGAFVLERAGEVAARAEKPSAWRARFVLHLQGRTLELRRLGWGRRFGLFEEGREVGRIAPAGVFTRRARIELPAGYPLPLQLFLFWLVLVIWRRDRQSSD
jgi:hypothetical protein